MEPQLFACVGLALDTIVIAALGVVVWQLFRLRRDIMAMLRVMRRIDRKAADTSGYGLQAELNEAPTQLTGNRQPEPNRPAAD